ncbi:MAG: aspartate 1-decarboxylase [Candidatus Aureabacteria bacterium]|nr:aspartate 1-decarboxylase [Candidatus Auribacterota bacterium]
MFRQMLKSKIHGAIITKKELYYGGSIGIDRALLLKGDMLPGEKVQVLNFNNGQRFETYIIEEKENSGTIALYGPAARMAEVGDKICVISYAFVDSQEAHKLNPRVVTVTEGNRIR